VKVQKLPVQMWVLHWEQMGEGKDTGMRMEVAVTKAVSDFAAALGLSLGLGLYCHCG
jgi:hypothetical protein